MKSVPNENILKLRELTNKMNKEDDYKVIVKKLKLIVDNGKVDIDKSDCSESKIKCYESMCSTITNLLTNIKFI
jgi:hypothetical protein